ncbi:hypothetical protein [Streptomyces sp. NPDC003247]|uniref:hypothetical protein n=1 Tax=Streptomyces sp. NPDC003247 TaxID=3364677 RepID=UPI0036B9E56D
MDTMLKQKPALTAALTVCVLGAALTGCGGGEPTDGATGATASATAASGTLCGAALTETARDSLRGLVGTDSYRTLGSDDGPQEVADALVADATAGGTSTEDHELCLAYDASDDSSSGTSVAYGLVDAEPENPASVFTRYRLGSATALARAMNAVVFLKCSSGLFKDGDGKEHLIQGELVNRSTSLEDTEETRRENLTVLHAASLAVARALGCADTAGLPAAFTVTRQDA